MSNQERIQQGRGAAVNRLMKLARKAQKKGEKVKAARLLQQAEMLRNESRTIWDM